jgi:putative MFS transporter
MDDLAIAGRIDRLRISSWHRRVLLILSIPLFFDVSDIFTFAYAAPVLRHLWGLSINQVALITSSCFLGMALGGTIGGMIADRIGRVPAMMLFTGIFSVFSLANGFATDMPTLLATRFATGLGIASATVTVITYIAEIYPAAGRGRWQSWAMVIALSGISVTSFVARAVVPWGDNGWRLVFIWGALGLPFLYLARRLPESPRWLANRGQLRRAEDSLIALEDAVRHSGTVVDAPADPVSRPEAPFQVHRQLGWPALFSPSYIGRTLSLCAIWFFQTVGFYGFMSWVPTLLAQHGFALVQSLNFVTLINAGSLPGALFAVFMADRVERKYLIAAVALAIAVFGLLYGLTFEPVLIVLFGFLAATAMNSFSALCFAYTPEQYPTEIRNSGSGLAYGVGRLANVINPFIIAALLSGFGYRSVFAYIAGAWVITAVIALVFGARTTGLSLERIDGAAHGHASLSGPARKALS